MRKTTFTLAVILAVLLAGADGKLKDKPSERDFDFHLTPLQETLSWLANIASSMLI